MDREEQIVSHYTNQIEDIKRIFETEFQIQIKKDQEFFKKEIYLLQDIEWVRKVAEQIDEQNSSIQEKLKKLEMEIYLDNNEKKFLIE